MTKLGIDYSTYRPGGAAIEKLGYEFVCRYLSHTPDKTISRAEADDLRNHGLAIVLVWESSTSRALAGRAAGQEDAGDAKSQAAAIGFPTTSRPIYFAVDFDASEAQQGALDEYLRGAAEVLGVPQVGVYGGYYVVKRCLDHGTATYAWQATAWSGGRVDPRAHIFQTLRKEFGTGRTAGADVDEALKDDYGQWPAPGTSSGDGQGTEGFLMTLSTEDQDFILLQSKRLDAALKGVMGSSGINNDYKDLDLKDFGGDWNLFNAYRAGKALTK